MQWRQRFWVPLDITKEGRFYWVPELKARNIIKYEWTWTSRMFISSELNGRSISKQTIWFVLKKGPPQACKTVTWNRKKYDQIVDWTIWSYFLQFQVVILLTNTHRTIFFYYKPKNLFTR